MVRPLKMMLQAPNPVTIALDSERILAGIVGVMPWDLARIALIHFLIPQLLHHFEQYFPVLRPIVSTHCPLFCDRVEVL